MRYHAKGEANINLSRRFAGRAHLEGHGVIAGLILAGGQSRRFGGNKSRARLVGRELCDWVAQRAGPLVDSLYLNSPVLPNSGMCATLPLVPDAPGDRLGPLAGVYAGLRWLETHPSGMRWLVTFPVDSPFFPDDLVSRLWGSVGAKELPAFASSGGRLHPAFALWPISILSQLDVFLYAAGGRKMMTFLKEAGAVAVSFEDQPFDSFFNINSQADLAHAEAIASQYFDLDA
jgi:molybdopterin-guanine dinucleotide biosynthesis protein A